MSFYNIVAATETSTVVAEYIAEYGSKALRSDAYQSESDLEKEFIRLLGEQGYEYLDIKSEADLIVNLKKQLELLNNYAFTDNEWQSFFNGILANPNNGIAEKSAFIQEDSIQNLQRDDGTTKNIMLIDKKNIHNNRLQVLNQYSEGRGKHANRYDVTILVNGLPLVHIELKRRGVAIREAFNQIERYQRDSFWAGCSLFEYVQIFVISNGTHTKYYSNTTRISHIKEQNGSARRRSKKTSNSFEFTSYWADANNKIIADLIDFTKTFFSKHTLLNILTRYCVFTSQKMLLVMRPYQIAATERILSRINVSSNYKTAGTVKGGGCIWHTTGSGKTLTSFKTAQLASKLPYIDKVLFVVDRKDLDYQTMCEYDRFCKGAANGNKSTRILQRQLEDKDEKGNPHEYKIIVTTIQKLDVFIRRNRAHDIYKKHVVIIFDECHRSQFGEMHTKVTRAYKNYHLFGFTGTPIFALNASAGGRVNLKTTEQAFGDKLHTYTIVDAINDGNVLPFRIYYHSTIKEKEKITDKQVAAIDRERALAASERINKIVTYVLDNFDRLTMRNSYYTLENQRVAGFNSIFAVSSIPVAIKYYMEFKRQLAASGRQLRIATIFSFGANDAEIDGQLPDESFDTDGLDPTARDFLEFAINDYNEMFGTSYSTAAEQFENYYKNISERMKNRELDLLIVVNMFLTGFDATTLNTLWVDKNLRYHGLIQAFSRTNRILNSVKTFGNIICFRNLEDETDKAIALFGDKEAGGVVLLKNYDAYYYGYDENGKHYNGYAELTEKLQQKYPLGEMIFGEAAQKDFILLFGSILRLKNILTAFDEFTGNEILSLRDFQDYQSIYLDLYQDWRKPDVEKENINDDVVFEIELIKQVEINIDYILMLIAKYHDSHCEDKEILTMINKAVNSSIELRSKKELIEGFIATINADTKVDEDWREFVKEQKETELEEIIAAEKLRPEETYKFINNSFRDGVLKTTGTDIDMLMPPVSRFGGGREKKKEGYN